MHIPIGVILNKIESELSLAKQEQHSERVREHLAAVRTLCDIVLDVKQETLSQVPPSTTDIKAVQRVYEEEDDANGNSLLDF
ncbi:YwdI family protein [Ectobacillus polymachus]|uniref:YwdI family protein n=1 Tax=Ectobacillus polymachus TaxID=1508806 RepID=UPI003A8AB091